MYLTKGQGLVEYTLLLALLVVVCIVAVGTLGRNTERKHQDSTRSLERAFR